MTRSASRYVFGSREYVAALRGYLTARTPELAATLAGAPFSLCEVYTEVPADVSAAGRVVITWGVTAGGELLFDDVERDDVSIKVVARWDTVLPLALVPMADAGPGMADAIASGDMTVHRNEDPPAFLATVHDALVALTAATDGRGRAR